MRMGLWVGMGACCAGLVAVSNVQAGQDGASGQFKVGEVAVSLTHALAFETEGLMDETKQDVVVVLSDRAWPEDLAFDDDMALQQLAASGELEAARIRLAEPGGNVTVFSSHHQGQVILPWRMYDVTWERIGESGVSGKLIFKEPADFDGTTWHLDAIFQATIREQAVADEDEGLVPGYETPKPVDVPVVESKNLVDFNKALIDALMNMKPEAALASIKAGADVNKPDKDGLAPLNWAILMCQVDVVKALIDAGADVNYERAPTLTVLQEAMACPDAVPLLEAAGAK